MRPASRGRSRASVGAGAARRRPPVGTASPRSTAATGTRVAPVRSVLAPPPARRQAGPVRPTPEWPPPADPTHRRAPLSSRCPSASCRHQEPTRGRCGAVPSARRRAAVAQTLTASPGRGTDSRAGDNSAARPSLAAAPLASVHHHIHRLASLVHRHSRLSAPDTYHEGGSFCFPNSGLRTATAFAHGYRPPAAWRSVARRDHRS